MEKEFGTLTAEQLKEFVGFFPTLLTLISDTRKRVADMDSAKFSKLMGSECFDYWWLYELPFDQHLAVIVDLLGLSESLQEMASQPDPQEALLGSLRSESEDLNIQDPGEDKGNVVRLIFSLGSSIRSIAAFGRSMSSLVADVRDNQNPVSLFKAIQIDRTVIGCPSAMQLIARAQMRGDVVFQKRFTKAWKGLSGQTMGALNKLRFTFLVLREMKVTISEARLEEIVVDVGAYSPSSTTRKNVRTYYRNSLKFDTI